MALLGYQNFVTTGLLSAGSSAMAVTGLQSPLGSPALAWQTASGTTTSYILIDSGATQTAWRSFGVFRTNLTVSATIRVRVGNPGMTVVTYDSGVLSGLIAAGYQQAVAVAPADVIGQACRIDIADPTNPDGFINIPLAYAGPAWVIGRGIDYNSNSGRVASEATVVSRDGTEYVTPLAIQRSYTASLSALSSDEAVTQLQPAIRASRSGGNVLLVPEEASVSSCARQAVFGRIRTVEDLGFERVGDNTLSWRGTVTERGS